MLATPMRAYNFTTRHEMCEQMLPSARERASCKAAESSQMRASGYEQALYRRVCMCVYTNNIPYRGYVCEKARAFGKAHSLTDMCIYIHTYILLNESCIYN